MWSIIIIIKEFLPIAMKLFKAYKSIKSIDDRNEIAQAIKNNNVEQTKNILNHIVNM